METRPFANYLKMFIRDYHSFPVAGQGRYVWRHELDALAFPVPTSFLARADRAGTLPRVKYGGRVCYAMGDLIGFLYMHAIPEYGLYYSRPVRAAKIIAADSGLLTVSAAFMPIRPGRGGNLCFCLPHVRQHPFSWRWPRLR